MMKTYYFGIILLMALAACGGGGGTNSLPAPVAIPSPLPTVTCAPIVANNGTMIIYPPAGAVCSNPAVPTPVPTRPE